MPKRKRATRPKPKTAVPPQPDPDEYMLPQEPFVALRQVELPCDGWGKGFCGMRDYHVDLIRRIDPDFNPQEIADAYVVHKGAEQNYYDHGFDKLLAWLRAQDIQFDRLRDWQLGSIPSLEFLTMPQIYNIILAKTPPFVVVGADGRYVRIGRFDTPATVQRYHQPQRAKATAAPAAAPSRRPPLSNSERAIWDIISAVPDGEAITEKRILDALSEKVAMEHGTFTKHMKVLKQHGVKNRRGVGYYIPRPE